MTTITIDISICESRHDFLNRVDGLVCVNGSRLVKVHRNEAILYYRSDTDNLDRIDLTPMEVATFIRNFLEEGFENDIKITT